MSAPSCATASDRHVVTRRPSSSTVQDPHWPWSQPFLGEKTRAVTECVEQRRAGVDGAGPFGAVHTEGHTHLHAQGLPRIAGGNTHRAEPGRHSRFRLRRGQAAVPAEGISRARTSARVISRSTSGVVSHDRDVAAGVPHRRERLVDRVAAWTVSTSRIRSRARVSGAAPRLSRTCRTPTTSVPLRTSRRRCPLASAVSRIRSTGASASTLLGGRWDGRCRRR